MFRIVIFAKLAFCFKICILHPKSTFYSGFFWINDPKLLKDTISKSECFKVCSTYVLCTWTTKGIKRDEHCMKTSYFTRKQLNVKFKFEQWKSRAPPRKSRAPPKMINLSFFYLFSVKKARHITLIEFKKKNLASISVYHNFFFLIKKSFQTFSSFSTQGSQMNSKFDFNDFFY